MNYKNRKISNPHRLLLNLTDQINLKGRYKYAALSNGSTYNIRKNIKSHKKTLNLKYESQRGTKKLNYAMRYILYKTFKIILNISLKKHEAVTNNPFFTIYVNQIENNITCRLKAVYHLELLLPKTMKLARSTKSKKTEDDNGENVLHLEITEALLVHCNITNNNS